MSFRCLALLCFLLACVNALGGDRILAFAEHLGPEMTFHVSFEAPAFAGANESSQVAEDSAQECSGDRCAKHHCHPGHCFFILPVLSAGVTVAAASESARFPPPPAIALPAHTHGLLKPPRVLT